MQTNKENHRNMILTSRDGKLYYSVIDDMGVQSEERLFTAETVASFMPVNSSGTWKNTKWNGKQELTAIGSRWQQTLPDNSWEAEHGKPDRC